MIQKWLNDTIRSFGARFKLSSFELNDRGLAAVRFENGNVFSVSCYQDKVAVSLGMPVPSVAEETLVAALTESHPWRQGKHAVRTAYIAGKDELLFVSLVNERDIEETVLGEVFDNLWRISERVRRTM